MPVARAQQGSAVQAQAAFRAPRIWHEGVTRVVYDLPAQARYQLSAGPSGLRLGVSGAVVSTASRSGVSPNVLSYRMENSQMTFETAFPLAADAGWRASEATIQSGTRVLILEFSPTLRGGATSSLRGLVGGVPAPVPPLPRGASVAGLVTPADEISAQPSQQPLPAPVAGVPDLGPNPFRGQVAGTPSGASLGTPRLGYHPGMTRFVLDLPPGTAYTLTPQQSSLRIELRG
ncbi:hypothetical protein ACFP81_11880 [Deinococcus lacus]|uniref:Uncharacterized protein n=1 Tax=Deinococcus lacus TaxID=392561 RepID=A0ABW1YE42_9DEIO